MTAQLSFPVCCLPGCKAIVAEWGDACATCQNDFGAYLVRVERDPDVTPEQVADQLAERNRGTMQAYTDQAAIELADTTTEPTPAVDAAVQWLAKRRIEDRILIDMPPAVVDIVRIS